MFNRRDQVFNRRIAVILASAAVAAAAGTGVAAAASGGGSTSGSSTSGTTPAQTQTQPRTKATPNGKHPCRHHGSNGASFSPSPGGRTGAAA